MTGELSLSSRFPKRNRQMAMDSDDDVDVLNDVSGSDSGLVATTGDHPSGTTRDDDEVEAPTHQPQNDFERMKRRMFHRRLLANEIPSSSVVGLKEKYLRNYTRRSNNVTKEDGELYGAPRKRSDSHDGKQVARQSDEDCVEQKLDAFVKQRRLSEQSYSSDDSDGGAEPQSQEGRASAPPHMTSNPATVRPDRAASPALERRLQRRNQIKEHSQRRLSQRVLKMEDVEEEDGDEHGDEEQQEKDGEHIDIERGELETEETKSREGDKTVEKSSLNSDKPTHQFLDDSNKEVYPLISSPSEDQSFRRQRQQQRRRSDGPPTEILTIKTDLAQIARMRAHSATSVGAGRRRRQEQLCGSKENESSFFLMGKALQRQQMASQRAEDEELERLHRQRALQMEKPVAHTPGQVPTLSPDRDAKSSVPVQTDKEVERSVGPKKGSTWGENLEVRHSAQQESKLDETPDPTKELKWQRSLPVDIHKAFNRQPSFASSTSSVSLRFELADVRTPSPTQRDVRIRTSTQSTADSSHADNRPAKGDGKKTRERCGSADYVHVPSKVKLQTQRSVHSLDLQMRYDMIPLTSALSFTVGSVARTTTTATSTVSATTAKDFMRDLDSNDDDSRYQVRKVADGDYGFNNQVAQDVHHGAEGSPVRRHSMPSCPSSIDDAPLRPQTPARRGSLDAAMPMPVKELTASKSMEWKSGHMAQSLETRVASPRFDTDSVLKAAKSNGDDTKSARSRNRERSASGGSIRALVGTSGKGKKFERMTSKIKRAPSAKGFLKSDDDGIGGDDAARTSFTRLSSTASAASSTNAAHGRGGYEIDTSRGVGNDFADRLGRNENAVYSHRMSSSTLSKEKVSGKETPVDFGGTGTDKLAAGSSKVGNADAVFNTLKAKPSSATAVAWGNRDDFGLSYGSYGDDDEDRNRRRSSEDLVREKLGHRTTAASNDAVNQQSSAAASLPVAKIRGNTEIAEDTRRAAEANRVRRQNNSQGGNGGRSPRSRIVRASEPGVVHMTGRAFGARPSWDRAIQAATRQSTPRANTLDNTEQVVEDQDSEEEVIHATVVNIPEMESDEEIGSEPRQETQEQAFVDESNHGVVYARAESMPSPVKMLWGDVRVRSCLIVGSLLLVMIAGIVTTVVFTIQASQEKNTTEKKNHELHPTAAPTRSMAPTIDPEPYHIILSLYSSREDLETKGTPQNMALQWMAQENKYGHGMETKEFVQRYALAVIYFALNQRPQGGHGWLSEEDWLNPMKHECDWSVSIVCVRFSGVRRVNQLNLMKNGLMGTIPPEIGLLDHLEILSMCENRISGPIPEEIGRLSSLRVLRLDDNKLSGKLPAVLGDVDFIEELNVAHNDLSGLVPDVMYNLKNLRILVLSHNHFSGTISSDLSKLESLTTIDLRSNNFFGALPEAFSTLPDLAKMHLDNNRFNGTLPIAATMLRLEVCTLSNNQFTGSIPGVAELVKIAGGNVFTMGKFAELVAKMRIRVVDMSGNRFHGTILPLSPYVTKMERFDISRNNFEGSLGSQDWIPAANLQDLNFSHNKFNGSFPDLMNHKRIRSLDLSGNNLEGRLPRFTNNTALEVLNLAGNSFSGEIPKSISTLSSLRKLVVNGNALDGAIPSDIGELAYLTDLVLDNNDLTGRIPTTVGNLQSLATMSLANNTLEGTVPSQLENLPKLGALDLSGNDLVGSVPSNVCARHEEGDLGFLKVDTGEVSCPCCSVRI